MCKETRVYLCFQNTVTAAFSCAENCATQKWNCFRKDPQIWAHKRTSLLRFLLEKHGLGTVLGAQKMISKHDLLKKDFCLFVNISSQKMAAWVEFPVQKAPRFSPATQPNFSCIMWFLHPPWNCPLLHEIRDVLLFPLDESTVSEKHPACRSRGTLIYHDVSHTLGELPLGVEPPCTKPNRLVFVRFGVCQEDAFLLIAWMGWAQVFMYDSQHFWHLHVGYIIKILVQLLLWIPSALHQLVTTTTPYP